MSTGVKPATAFWVIAIAALLWNLLGVMQYLGMTMATHEDWVSSYGEEMANLYAAKPAWATGAFAIAVFAGAIGCIGLLLRKAWAKHLFIASLLGVIVHDIWMFMSGASGGAGAVGYIMILLVLVVAAFLIWFSQKKIDEGVLT